MRKETSQSKDIIMIFDGPNPYDDNGKASLNIPANYVDKFSDVFASTLAIVNSLRPSDAYMRQ